MNMKKLHHFIGQFNLADDTITLTDRRLVHQLADVLQLRAGETIVLCDGQGTKVTAHLSALGQGRVIVQAISRTTTSAHPPLHLFCSLIKKDRFEFVAQKATELGATHITPLLAARTVKHHLNLARMQTIATEAAEQSEQFFCPAITAPVLFSEALKKYPPEQTFFFHPNGLPVKKIPVSAALPTALYIGPEGGWTDDEVAQAEKYGARIVSLGSGILRAETAAIIAAWWGSQAAS